MSRYRRRNTRPPFTEDEKAALVRQWFTQLPMVAAMLAAQEDIPEWNDIADEAMDLLEALIFRLP